MSMNTPTGGIIQTTAIKDFVELEDIDTQQYLLGINNITTGDGSKIKLEKILEDSISTDTGNTLEIGSDNKLLNVEEDTGVQAGTYAYPQNLVVNSKGRIIGVVSGSPAPVPIATTSQAGIVRPDGTSITVTEEGIISSPGDDKLSKKQVTNCLLEVPQRIKYTLENGTLTILAGSVIIVPYGVEDLTEQYPVGSTFINANFKVYETQYLDGKFFVYAEVQENIVRTEPPYDSKTRFVHINLTDNTIIVDTIGTSGASDVSGAKTLHYQDTKNIMQRTNSSGVITQVVNSLPFARVACVSNGSSSYIFGYVLQTFEGIGYIGSALWVDKGVKHLIPDGLNEDGSLKNIEYTQPKFQIRHLNMGSGNKSIRLYTGTSETGAQVSYSGLTTDFYDVGTNRNVVFTTKKQLPYQCGYVGTFTVQDNAITNFHINPPLNINSMCDGVWVGANLTLASSGTTAPITEPLLYDLSDYLPKDDCSYEVIVNGRAATGSTSGNNVLLTIHSSIIPTGMYICQAHTRAAASSGARGNAILPIGADRILTLENATSNVGTFGLYLVGYRRLGGNF